MNSLLNLFLWGEAYFTGVYPLMHQAALAERHCIDNPGSFLMNFRFFGELLAKNIAARFGKAALLKSFAPYAS